ncbi:NECAP-like protein CG9132 isoform X2 [Oratosquilla oratoria]
MRLVSKTNDCIMKLEDKTSGELFALCPIDKYPGVAIEAVTDSSRYFVIRIQDEAGECEANSGGRSAFIGIGFGDRSDSFDLNVALQDHFKWVKKEEEAEKQKEEGKPSLDLGFKEGQTIKINMKITKKEGQEGSTSRPKPKSGAPLSGVGILPPPPGGVKLAPPPASGAASNQSSSNDNSNLDLLGGLSTSGTTNNQTSGENWGDFASANTTPPQPSTDAANGSGSGWVTF